MNPTRIDSLAAQLRARDWDAALLCASNTLGYLTGVFEYGYERFLMLAVRSDGQVRGIVPALSLTQFERHGVTGLTGWSDGESPGALFESLADDWDLRRAVLAVENTMRADHLLMIQEALPAAKFWPADPAISALRSIKSPEELALLKEAADHVDAVFDQMVNHVRPGLTERQVEAKLRSLFAERGVEATFCIIATGPNSAEPHHLSDDTVLEPGHVVLLDFGCQVGGYQADITRMVSLGEPSARVKEVHAAVYAAYTAGFEAVRPGVLASQVDAAARGVLRERGFAKFFVHRTGHGIGLDGHEAPNMSADNHSKLVAGNVFSVEPGVYLLGEFGVRLENIVACGMAGYDAVSLNATISEELRVIEG